MNVSTDQVTLTAPDISCGHCVATITKALGKLDGVQSVQADAATKQVRVEYTPGAVSVAQIAQTMDDAGYPVQQ